MEPKFKEIRRELVARVERAMVKYSIKSSSSQLNETSLDTLSSRANNGIRSTCSSRLTGSCNDSPAQTEILDYANDHPEIVEKSFREAYSN